MLPLTHPAPSYPPRTPSEVSVPLALVDELVDAFLPGPQDRQEDSRAGRRIRIGGPVGLLEPIGDPVCEAEQEGRTEPLRTWPVPGSRRRRVNPGL